MRPDQSDTTTDPANTTNRTGLRRPSWLTWRRALVVVVVVAAVVAAVGPSRGGTPGPPSATAATAYVGSQHHGTHVPAISVAVISGSHHSVRAFGAPTSRPFIIGSVSKSFTAMATMQLVESGQVDLDRPVTTYVPAFRTRNAHRSARITVRQLLTQTSGLTTDAGLEGFRYPATSIDQQVAALARQTAEVPGKFRYSNANWEVLGALIQNVS